MVCEYVKIKNDKGFYLWFNLDQPFEDEAFFALISSVPGLEITEKKVLFRSMAPAQVIEEIITNQGKFCISKQFEDLESGIDIYSEDQVLMSKILQQLEASPSYHARNT